ncbi:hypothetical protein CLV62_12517 [Dysgonomonas alginatilytica]|uniref:Uncharacterized protein n=1 Tax=Dysgonomonas alginatilytica TaxID=1605892 RepID=A0A2V3PLX5_9BACT|nr:hypothetical protein [Dysgonomonas alginatilytica]PXV61184.1 hypothetical protein CLV62_12517 [Dysgonomonas alginatilytica]
MEIFLYLIALAIIVILCGASANNRRKKQGRTSESVSTPSENTVNGTSEELKLLTKVREIFESGKAMPLYDIYKEVEYNEAIEILPTKENSKASELFHQYCHAISNRYYIKYYELKPSESNKINLRDGELIYYTICDSKLFDSKNLYRAVDLGNIYFTNKRLLFVGKQFNVVKSYTYKSIITYNRYKDAVSISIENQNPKLFKFEPSKDSLFIQDGLNELSILLPRFINNNYTQDSV